MIRRLLVFILLISFTLSHASSIKEQASVRCYSVEDGLSSNLVYDIVKDMEGFVWIATANGLNRFDGYSFNQSYDSSSVNPKAQMKAALNIFVDNKNQLWLGGTKQRILDNETQSFKSLNFSEGEYIRAITQDEYGNIWAGGNNTGLIKLNQSGEIIQKYSIGSGLYSSVSIETVDRILPDGKGGLWVATNSPGVEYFNIETGEFTHYVPEIIEKSFRDIMFSAEGELWGTTEDGVYVYETKSNKWKHFVFSAEDRYSLTTNDVWSVSQDTLGRIWIGTDKKGLDMFERETGRFINYNPEDVGDTIPPGAIFSMTNDVNGDLWLSVFNFGICRFSTNDKKFELFKKPVKEEDMYRGLSFNNVLGLHETLEGHIWIGTDGGGLNLFKPETGNFVHFKNDPSDSRSLSSNSVISISEDKKGNLWLGTWGGGLNRLNVKTKRFIHYNYENTDGRLAGNNIFATLVNPDGTIWLSVWDYGLQLFDPESEKFIDYSTENSEAPFRISLKEINVIFSTESKDMLIGGHDGLEFVRFADNNVENINLTSANDIYDIYEAGNGVLWIATTEGLVKYNYITGDKQVFDKNDGLISDFITGIEIDEQGLLWLGTLDGLIRFNPETYSADQYGAEVGIQGLQFNRYSHLQARNGMMYFGGTQGLNRFYPSKLSINLNVPRVVFTDLELFQKPVPVGADSVLHKHISCTDELSLNADQNDITFVFTALDYVAPEMNCYKYKLEGFDHEWVEVGSERRRVRYTNLNPGKYVFRVQGSNNDGIWNTKGASVKLTIIPPWWQTKTAIVLAVLLLIGSVYFYIWLSIKSSMRKQKILEGMVKDKTKELADAMKEIEEANLFLENRVKDRTSKLEKEIEMRKTAEAQIFHTAIYDWLTDLPNRTWLVSNIKSRLKMFKENRSEQFVLVYLDVVQFRLINDAMGYSMGNEIIKAVATRLLTLLPDNSFITHLGGDKFIFLMERVENINEGIDFAERLLNEFRKSFKVLKHNISLTLSIGIAISSEHHLIPEDMLRDVNIALSKAKESGKACYCVFDIQLYKELQREIELVTDLKDAIGRNQFFLVYQPIIDIRNGRLKSFEALIRWNHPEKGLIPPDVFVTLAESHGLMHEIGLWVLKEACAQISEWIDKYPEFKHVGMGINISAKQIGYSSFLDEVNNTLEQTGISPSQIKFEITETSIMDDAENAKNILSKVREKGIEIAIDDFGTGYSSLSYLHEFPAQYLKIDKSFVDRVESSHDGVEMVKTIISLAKSMNMLTIAEGIETSSQLDILGGFLCDYAQGYLIGKPMKKEEIESGIAAKNENLIV